MADVIEGKPVGTRSTRWKPLENRKRWIFGALPAGDHRRRWRGGSDDGTRGSSLLPKGIRDEGDRAAK
ncbi:hypothetical protein M8494_22125 [Serratia ureilytica]